MEHPVVSREEWLAARKALLAKEKAWTRLRDELSEERRALPWVRIDKDYVFEGPNGKETLADLFAGAANWSSSISCSGPAGRTRASAARSEPTTSTASSRWPPNVREARTRRVRDSNRRC